MFATTPLAYLVANDIHRCLVICAADFKHLIGEIIVEIELMQRLKEEFSLKRKVHPDRAIETDEPRMERYVSI